jgi:hypothetical protein
MGTWLKGAVMAFFLILTDEIHSASLFGIKVRLSTIK